MPARLDLPEDLVLLLADAANPPSERPWITLSYAQSLDGSIAVVRDRPLALSGPESLRLTHQLRARHQAILVGIGTVLADDPRLNVRLADGEDPQPVVLDSQLRFPLDARLMGSRKPPWIITTAQASFDHQAALEREGAHILRVASHQVALVDVLQVLRQAGMRSVMVEGGARVITAILRARLVDAMVITITPRLVGGIRAVEGLLSSSHSSLKGVDFPGLEQMGVCQLGKDMLVWGRPSWVEPGS
jgi:3,4-dihydroxy 2-butanone 4-phosphate synthase/GTP cyclohydrolase II